jgi:hypothetical protein
MLPSDLVRLWTCIDRTLKVNIIPLFDEGGVEIRAQSQGRAWNIWIKRTYENQFKGTVSLKNNFF